VQGPRRPTPHIFIYSFIAAKCRLAFLIGKWRSQSWSPTWKGGGLREQLYFPAALLCTKRRFLSAALQCSRMELVCGSSGSMFVIDHKLDRGELGAKDFISLKGQSLWASSRTILKANCNQFKFSSQRK
jgi:hypothetical protein